MNSEERPRYIPEKDDWDFPSGESRRNSVTWQCPVCSTYNYTLDSEYYNGENRFCGHCARKQILAVKRFIVEEQRRQSLSFLAAIQSQINEVSHLYEIQRKARGEAKSKLEFLRHFDDNVSYPGTNRISIKKVAKKLAIAKELGYL